VVFRFWDVEIRIRPRRLPAVPQKAFAGQTLRLFIYSGFWEKTIRETFAPRFKAQTGATVIPDPGWWDSIPKLKVSPPGQPAFDLVLTDAIQGYPAIREGLFQKIDMNRIPNLAKIAPSALDNWVYREGYGIPFPDGVMTLGYNRKLLNFEPRSWGDLMRDDVKGKLGLYNSFYMSLYTFACLKVAVEGRPGAAAAECANNLNGVIQFARENRDRVKYWWPTSTDMALSLSQENCAIGNMHSGAMLSVLRQRADLGAIVPDADRAVVQLMWVIPVGARKELAEEAINLILSEEIQEALAMKGSATPVLSVAQKTAASDPLWGKIYPSTEEEFKDLQYYPYDAYFKDWDNLVATWDREILRKG
jgi:spermidine/putrescine-binding protein